MITAVVLAGYAALMGAAVPPLLARAHWAHRAPTAAVFAWQGLMVTFVVTAALSVHHLVLGEHHVHERLFGLLTFCGLATSAPEGRAPLTIGSALAIAAPMLVVLLPAGWLIRCIWRARRARVRQLDMLVLAGSRHTATRPPSSITTSRPFTACRDVPPAWS
ncbi:hypothetical protein ACFQ0G_50255 [Streptomyces chiangmaiensis]